MRITFFIIIFLFISCTNNINKIDNEELKLDEYKLSEKSLYHEFLPTQYTYLNQRIGQILKILGQGLKIPILKSSMERKYGQCY